MSSSLTGGIPSTSTGRPTLWPLPSIAPPSLKTAALNSLIHHLISLPLSREAFREEVNIIKQMTSRTLKVNTTSLSPTLTNLSFKEIQMDPRAVSRRIFLFCPLENAEAVRVSNRFLQLLHGFESFLDKNKKILFLLKVEWVVSLTVF